MLNSTTATYFHSSMYTCVAVSDTPVEQSEKKTFISDISSDVDQHNEAQW